MVSFPASPEHGTIYEPQPGVFYIYDMSTKTWVRTEGGIPSLASPLAAGLMSSEDLQKLNRVVIPPPQTTLTAEDCIGSLGGGIIEFRVGDQFLTIEGTAKLMNEVAGIGASDAQIVTRELHQHTNSFDFHIDTDIFYEYMESSGKFRVITSQGRTGPPGDPGPPGDDNLPYGSKGPDGDPGANAPFDVELEVDPIALEKKNSSRRAVIALEVESVSEDENYLVAHRATIGNPDACPSDIRLTSSLRSTWVVCIPTSLEGLQTSIDECFACTGDLYYIDLSVLLGSIENEFDREVATLKSGMESIVSFWTTVMSGVFDEQKASMCCALEHCRSQTRNQDTRQYIEQSRIQAAQSDHSIIIEGDPDEDTKSVTIMEQSCLPGGFGTDNANGLPNNQDPIGGSQCIPWIMYDEDGKPIKYPECPAGFTPRSVHREYIASLTDEVEVAGQGAVDKIIAEILAQPVESVKIVESDVGEPDVGEPDAGELALTSAMRSVPIPPMPSELVLDINPSQKSVSGDLAKGLYLIDISGLIEVDGQYTAGSAIYYEHDGPRVRRIPDILSSDRVELAKAYRSLAVQINHDGGPVSVSLNVPEYATGSLRLLFISGKRAVKKQNKLLKSLKMPESEPKSQLLDIRDRAGYCEISSDYLRWYEKQWKLRKCSGVVVDISGQDFVIIFCSNSRIACAPASIAWPTLDGENFVPSTGKVMFHNLRKLEQRTLELMGAGKYRVKVGNLGDITKIFFPIA